MKILTIIFLIVFRAFTCDDVNLYDDLRLSKVISNQGDMHTCYAHSLSALYSFEAQSEVNPYWLAFIHKDRLLHWSPRNLNFSLLSWAFKDFRAKGLCDADLLSRNLERLKSSTSYSDDQYFYLLQSYFLKEKNIEKLMSFLSENSNDFEHSWNKDQVQKIITHIESNHYEKLFDYLREEVFSVCENTEEVIGSLRSIGRGFESNSRLHNKLSKVLDSRKIVSIGLCPDGAYKKLDSSYNVNSKPRILKSTSKKCGAHYVNIVGKRKGKKSCEYLIRNSYPGFWAHESFECLCLDENQKQVTCKKSEAANKTVLGCWIPKDKILNNTYDISFFK